MQDKELYLRRMNYYLRRFILDALLISLLRPKRALFMLSTLVHQWKAARRRARQAKQGLKVPPYMIISITGKCNLQCHGCYAQVHNAQRAAELTIAEWEKLLREADGLGVSVALVAGGEPLTKPEFFEVFKAHPSVLFPVFTNGLLIDDAYVERFRQQQNVIPIVSVEGLEEMTDRRRGAGVFTGVTAALSKLDAAGVFYGISVTVTRKNFEAVTSEAFIRSFMKNGCSLFFFIEYIPVNNDTDLVLTDVQREAIHALTDRCRAAYKGLFVTFPGDEREYDGCLAAGRGFFHVAVDGSLEPCPFAPYADRNVRNTSLKEALASPLLSAIRENHKMLEESGGGCTLWNNREWVSSLLEGRERGEM
jgi:MoaA/NifB/PqqE/SkfB family radical SAM enzyme